MEPLLRRRYRSVSVCGLASVAFLLGPRALAQEPPVHASIECAAALEPGRIRCEVEARATGNLTLLWGDVEIVSTPAFVAPLRGRIGPRDATKSEPTTMRWALALVARSSGSGEVNVNVRVVACSAAGGGAERCTPIVTKASGRVVVGH